MFSKDIIDIYLIDNKIGVERMLKTSRKMLEEQIAVLEYSGEKLLKDKVVEETDLPPFIVAFYYFIFTKNRIPTQEEMFEVYYFINSFSFDAESFIYKGCVITKNGLKARILRTFPSLIRDFHFYLILKESGLFSEVFYSLQNDYYKGLDLQVIYKSKVFFVSIYLDSIRGTHYKKKKYSRHDYSSVTEITMEVSKDTMYQCGKINLLTDQHLNKLIEKIENLC